MGKCVCDICNNKSLYTHQHTRSTYKHHTHTTDPTYKHLLDKHKHQHTHPAYTRHTFIRHISHSLDTICPNTVDNEWDGAIQFGTFSKGRICPVIKVSTCLSHARARLHIGVLILTWPMTPIRTYTHPTHTHAPLVIPVLYGIII